MNILESLQIHRRTLGILVDPEKLDVGSFSAFAKALQSSTAHLKQSLDLDQIICLIGGSTMQDIDLEEWMFQFKKQIDFKLLLFPGSHNQISEHADGLLFLNLISGRNPEYLIGQQVVAAKKLKNSKLEIIPTAYVLVDGGTASAVQRVSKTAAMDQKNIDLIVETSIAGQLMGHQLIYLEAGSGAMKPVDIAVVQQVSQFLRTPLIVGGGLRDLHAIHQRFDAGARMIVVGTAIEQNLNWKG